MSKYTTELRYICENAAGLTESAGYNQVDTIVATAAPVIFNFDWPIFQESYRLPLEKKILKHYYTREISAETVGLWKLWLNTTLNEIMPYYNQLYNSTLLEFNPLYDVDYKREGARNGVVDRQGTESSKQSDTGGQQTKEISSDKSSDTGFRESKGNDSEINLFNDTPQNATSSGNLFATDQSGKMYLTDARQINRNNSDNETRVNDNVTTRDRGITLITNNDLARELSNASSENTLDNYYEIIRGKMGARTYSSMLKEFRETFLNIDMRVIGDLRELFFTLW